MTYSGIFDEVDLKEVKKLKDEINKLKKEIDLLETHATIKDFQIQKLRERLKKEYEINKLKERLKEK